MVVHRRAITLLLLIIAFSAYAQDTSESSVLETITLSDLDLSVATISQAGPNSFYVRSVGIDDGLYSLLLESDSAGVWSVSGIVAESTNIIPADTILDFATISVEDATTIRIDGVLVGTTSYGGSLSVGSDAGLTLAGNVAQGSTVVNAARQDALEALVAAQTGEEYDETLTAQITTLQNTIAQVQAERDALLLERDSLATDSVSLGEENVTLRAENDTLEDQISDLQDQNSRLQDNITTMTSEVSRLRELVQDYQDAAGAEDSSADDTSVATDVTTDTTSDDAGASDGAGWTMPGDYIRRSDLDAAAASLTNELKSLSDRVALLEAAATDLADLEATIRQGMQRLDSVGTLATAADIARLEQTIQDGIDQLESVGSLPASTPSTTTGGGDTGSSGSAPSSGRLLPVEVLEARVASATEAAVEEAFSQAIAAAESAAAEAAAAATEAAIAELVDATAAAAANAAASTAAAARPAATGTTGSTDADLAAAEAALASVRAQLAALQAQSDLLETERQAIEERVLNEILDHGFVAMMEERLTNTVVRGFGNATPDTGDWTVYPDWAIQNDADAYFARLAMPTPQRDDPILYSFRVRSVGSGWVGVGLHLFVSEVERRRGYGMGRSLLVWLTRDPEIRKNELTYLQLYRSDDDINMGRALDASIPESLADFMQVDVLYEPETQYITVAVNGEDRVRYRTWFGINAGLEIALRTLGRAEFRDFTVRTMP